MLSCYSFPFLNPTFQSYIPFVPLTTLLNRFFVIHIHNPLPLFVSPINFYSSISISVCISINICRRENSTQKKNYQIFFLPVLKTPALRFVNIFRWPNSKHSSVNLRKTEFDYFKTIPL